LPSSGFLDNVGLIVSSQAAYRVWVGGNTIFNVDLSVEGVIFFILLHVILLHICHRFEKSSRLPLIASPLVNQWAVNTLIIHSLIYTGYGFFYAQGDTHD